MSKEEFIQQAEQGEKLVLEFSLNKMPKEVMQMALFAGWQVFENKSLDYQAKMDSVLMAVEAAYHFGKGENPLTNHGEENI
jgi:hypothetical protein